MKRILTLFLFLLALNSALAQRTYKVGDYYDDGKKQGVVFWVDETGTMGKIVSLTQSKQQWCSDEEYQRKINTGANNEQYGLINQLKIAQINGWREKYPAFKWCADQGEGWYLPAIGELQTLLLNDAVYNAVNRTLEAKGATKLFNKDSLACYWSSTECDEDTALFFFMEGICLSLPVPKNSHFREGFNLSYVRAVAVFDVSAQSATNTRPTVKPTPTTNPAQTATTAKPTPATAKTNQAATTPKAEPTGFLAVARDKLKYGRHIARYDHIAPRQLIYTPLALFTSREIPMDALVSIVDGTKGIGKVEVSTSADGKQKYATVRPTEFYCRLKGFEEVPCALMSAGYESKNHDRIKTLSYTYSLPANWKRAEVKAYAKAFSEDMHRIGVSWTEEKEGFTATLKGNYIQIQYSGKGEDNFIYVYIRLSDQEQGMEH